MTQRKQFEQWYATHAFNYERDPIGSRDCGLQWAAWQAARVQAIGDVADILAEYDCLNSGMGREIRALIGAKT